MAIWVPGVTHIELRSSAIMIRDLLRFLFHSVGVFAAGILGFGVGLLGIFVIARSSLGPPPDACGLGVIVLMPAVWIGMLAAAVGAIVGRIIKGTLTASLLVAAVAIPLCVWSSLVSVERDWTEVLRGGAGLAAIAIVIGTAAGFVGACVGYLFIRVDEAFSAAPAQEQFVVPPSGGRRAGRRGSAN